MKKSNHSQLKTISLILSSALLCTLGLGTSYADDTEIFQTGSVGNFKNNVMLMFDTSGSMGRHVLEFDKVILTDEHKLNEDGSTKTDAELLTEFPDRYNPNINYDGSTNDTVCADESAYYTPKNASGGDEWYNIPYVIYEVNNFNLPRSRCRELDDRETNDRNERLINWSDTNRIDDTENVDPIDDLDCVAARTALETVGFFIDEPDTDGNYACTTTSYRSRIYFSGHFLDFVKSRIDPTTHSPLTNWENFFVKTRLQVIKNVMGRILTNQDENGNPLYNVNIGIMRFDSDDSDGLADGAEIVASMRSIQDPSVATTVLDSVNALTAEGGTPIQESFADIYRYFAGGAAAYNSGTSDPTAFEFVLDSSGNETTTRSTTYNSPITHACQKNSLLYLTDGFPSSDTGNTARTVFSNDMGLTDCDADGKCMAAAARYMYTNDLITDTLPGPADQQGEQKVETTAIGFVVQNDEFLKVGSETEGGGGGFVQANNTADIEKAFTDSIISVDIGNSTFTSPAVAVSSYNRLTNRDELYFSMFDPEVTVQWGGNLKKYKINDGVIIDQKNQAAVNPATGLFYDKVPVTDVNGITSSRTARSFWSTADDGASVTLGGFASRMNSTFATAKVGTTLNEPAAGTSAASGTGSVINTRLIESDYTTNISDADLGFTGTDDERKELLAWATGFDYIKDASGTVSVTERSNRVGAPLHSTPVTITYNLQASATDDPDTVIYFGTNDGFIHAVNAFPLANEDMDVFSYIPKDLLSNLADLKANGSNIDKTPIYGMDGPITSWIKDLNFNGVVDTSNPDERAYIYTTMRRGGKNIYALDVTSKDSPALKWVIKSGQTGFENLGQTWSKPTFATVRLGPDDADIRNVLFFGGGYDEDQDTATVRTADTEGNSIYMVDAETGELLWSVGPPTAPAIPSSASGPSTPPTLKTTIDTQADMLYSIPADLSVLDINNDGFADRLYAGDMGGQMWRFDFNQNLPSNSLPLSAGEFAVGGVIADVAGSSTTDNRRLYYKPSAAVVTDDLFGTYIALAFGTGFRANPISDKATLDRFYSIKDDFNLGFQYDTNGIVIPLTQKTNFLDITSRATDIYGTNSQAISLVNALKSTQGYFLTLANTTATVGEKVLANPLIADNKIFFTTYIPPTPSADSCDPTSALGTGRLYTLNLVTGGVNLSDDEIAELNVPNNTVLANTSVYTELDRGGIPPAPVAVFEEPKTPPTATLGENNCDTFSKVSLVIATQVENPNICNRPARTYWNERDYATIVP